jgi:glycosyltransferase involved in cell wall biosynthesis
VNPQVTIVVPYHEARAENGMLDTCLWSLRQQEPVPGGIRVLPVLDDRDQGAAYTRQRGFELADTPWVGFLDSDDWAYPDHVATLFYAAVSTESDYVFSYFTIHDMWEGARPDLDPLRTFGKPFDNANPHQTTGTILVRKAALAEHGIHFREQDADRFIDGTELRYGEDWDLALQCATAGLRITHVPRRTWAWRIGHHNTSGLPGHGDAEPTRKGQ